MWLLSVGGDFAHGYGSRVCGLRPGVKVGIGRMRAICGGMLLEGLRSTLYASTGARERTLAWCGALADWLVYGLAAKVVYPGMAGGLWTVADKVVEGC